ncbi:hypothetical protein GGGNBK_21115 [Sporosarcina sp. ANT_H38]
MRLKLFSESTEPLLLCSIIAKEHTINLVFTVQPSVKVSLMKMEGNSRIKINTKLINQN